MASNRKRAEEKVLGQKQSTKQGDRDRQLGVLRTKRNGQSKGWIEIGTDFLNFCNRDELTAQVKRMISAHSAGAEANASASSSINDLVHNGRGVMRLLAGSAARQLFDALKADSEAYRAGEPMTAVAEWYNHLELLAIALDPTIGFRREDGSTLLSRRIDRLVAEGEMRLRKFQDVATMLSGSGTQNMIPAIKFRGMEAEPESAARLIREAVMHPSEAIKAEYVANLFVESGCITRRAADAVLAKQGEKRRKADELAAAEEAEKAAQDAAAEAAAELARKAQNEVKRAKKERTKTGQARRGLKKLEREVTAQGAADEATPEVKAATDAVLEAIAAVHRCNQKAAHPAVLRAEKAAAEAAKCKAPEAAQPHLDAARAAADEAEAAVTACEAAMAKLEEAKAKLAALSQPTNGKTKRDERAPKGSEINGMDDALAGVQLDDNGDAASAAPPVAEA